MSNLILRYRIIPKISPTAYIFQRSFLRGLFLEGPIFGGAYVRREICVSKLIGLACSGKEIYHFCFVLLCFRGQIPSTSPPGGLYSKPRRFNGEFFVLRFWGLIFGGAYFRNFTVSYLAVIDTRHLCTRLRTDGIKKQCHVVSQGPKICHYKRSQPSLFTLEDKK